MSSAPATSTVPRESPVMRATAGAQATEQWQRRLLPVMVGMVMAVTIFFLVASLIQLYSIHTRIEASPALELEPALALLAAPGSGETRQPQTTLEFARWKTLAILEGHTLERRYHQANVLLMARVWVRYLGFVTGMILALVGAVFIMAKLREPASRLEAEGQGFKGSLATNSPGIVLAVLGTGLMLATILSHNEIDVRDAPPYTSDPSFFTSVTASRVPPKDISNLTEGAETSATSRTGQKSAGSGANVNDLLDEIDKRIGGGSGDGGASKAPVQ